MFNLSGHGNFDLAAYDDFMAGKLTDAPLQAAAIEQGLKSLPKFGNS